MSGAYVRSPGSLGFNIIMDLDARNPDFVAREHQRHVQTSLDVQSDQRFCY